MKNYVTAAPSFVFSTWVDIKNGMVVDYYNPETFNVGCLPDAEDVSIGFFCIYSRNGNLQDLFSENESGLFYISGKVITKGLEDGVEFIVETIFEKTKCKNFGHLRRVYENVLGLLD